MCETSVVSSIIIAVVSASVSGTIVAVLSQWLIAKRERRAWKDNLRLDLYSAVIELVGEYAEAKGRQSMNESTLSVPLQKRTIELRSRLVILGSPNVRECYTQYVALARQSIERRIDERPENDDVDRCRDALLKGMADEFAA